MKRLKEWLQDFPHQGGLTVVALYLILTTGTIVQVRLAFGKPFPDGYDTYLIFLAGIAGVTTVGMIGKRLTDYDYAKATNPAPASPVTVEAPATVQVDGKDTDDKDKDAP